MPSFPFRRSSSAFVAVAERMMLAGESSPALVSNSRSCDLRASRPHKSVPKAIGRPYRPLVYLPPLRYGLLEIVHDPFGKVGFVRAFYALDERDECRVEVDTVLGHHRHCLFAHEVGLLDGAHASPKAPPDPFVRVDMRHNIGATSIRFLDGSS